MRVRYRAQALADIDDIRRYLQERSPNGAQNVLGSIYAAVKFIAENPHGSEQTDEPNVRMKAIVEYPYKVFYSVVADTIEILHVRHSARQPWTGER
jgi:toxin ParE1/3/4